MVTVVANRNWVHFETRKAINLNWNLLAKFHLLIHFRSSFCIIYYSKDIAHIAVSCFDFLYVHISWCTFSNSFFFRFIRNVLYIFSFTPLAKCVRLKHFNIYPHCWVSSAKKDFSIGIQQQRHTNVCKTFCVHLIGSRILFKIKSNSLQDRVELNAQFSLKKIIIIVDNEPLLFDTYERIHNAISNEPTPLVLSI